MNKEKIDKLNKYADILKDKLNDKTPNKHINHKETYKQFLNRELETVKLKIEKLSIN